MLLHDILQIDKLSEVAMREYLRMLWVRIMAPSRIHLWLLEILSDNAWKEVVVSSSIDVHFNDISITAHDKATDDSGPYKYVQVKDTYRNKFLYAGVFKQSGVTCSVFSKGSWLLPVYMLYCYIRRKKRANYTS